MSTAAFRVGARGGRFPRTCSNDQDGPKDQIAAALVLIDHHGGMPDVPGIVAGLTGIASTSSASARGKLRTMPRRATAPHCADTWQSCTTNCSITKRRRSTVLGRAGTRLTVSTRRHERGRKCLGLRYSKAGKWGLALLGWDHRGGGCGRAVRHLEEFSAQRLRVGAGEAQRIPRKTRAITRSRSGRAGSNSRPLPSVGELLSLHRLTTCCLGEAGGLSIRSAGRRAEFQVEETSLRD
jgi:hypothetical protein